MSFGFGFGLPSWQALSGGFSPASLFSGGTVPGAWYDPGDLSTMFDTSAGTTPVAMPGQGAAVPVGLMLDKSQGLVLGPELVTNPGPFVNTTGWVNTSLPAPATPSVVNGRLRVTSDIAGVSNDPRVYATITGLTIGKSYKITFVGSSGTATNCAVAVTNTVPAGGVTGGTGTNVVGTDVAASFIRIAAATTEYLRVVVNGSTMGDGKYVELSSITVKELAGNHAIAINNTTARPELRARVNLLTYSEDFGNAAWSKTPTSSAANTTAVNDPFGGTTADLYSQTAGNPFIGQNITLTTATPVTVSCYFRKDVGDFVNFFCADTATISNGFRCFLDMSTGQKGTEGVVGSGSTFTSASVQDAGNGWYRLSITGQVGAATTAITVGFYVTATDNTGTRLVPGSVYIWGADLRPANIGANVPAYQRIADANTYDTNGFPLYLRFDGIDDGMYTPANLNLSATDKVGVFAGLRKLSDATSGLVTEFSADRNANNGAWTAGYGPLASDYGFSSKGTISTTVASASIFSPPITNVLTGLGDIGGDSAILRVNGAQVGSNTGDQGTGNYGTYPLYIGSRGNSSLWLNGHLYSLAVVGSAVSAGNISAMENWVAGKTGIQI